MVGIYPARLLSENIRSEQVVREEPYRTRLCSTLRMRGHHSQQPPANHFLTGIDTAARFVWQWQIAGKNQCSWTTANKEKENKQPLLAMFSSSVQESQSCSLHY